MMRTAFFTRGVAALLAGTVVVFSGPVALAADCSTQEQAIEQYQSVVQAASQRMRADGEPDTLRKDKVGLVLVARAAASRETDQAALRRDLNALAQQFAKSPRDLCRAVDSLRRKHGL